MIRLTRLNGSELYLNADLIATVESRPDTVVTLVDGKHFVVADSADDVIMRVPVAPGSAASTRLVIASSIRTGCPLRGSGHRLTSQFASRVSTSFRVRSSS